MKIRWNPDGFESLRRAPETRDLVSQAAARIARTAGSGYVVSERSRRTRYGAIVYTGDFRTAYYNQRDNVLLTAMVNASIRVENEHAKNYTAKGKK